MTLLEAVTVGKDHQPQAWNAKGRNICCNPVKAVFLGLGPRQKLWLEQITQWLLDWRLKGNEYQPLSPARLPLIEVKWKAQRSGPLVHRGGQRRRENRSRGSGRVYGIICKFYLLVITLNLLFDLSKQSPWCRETQVLSSHAFTEVSVFCWPNYQAWEY